MWKENPFTHLRPTTLPETLDRSLDVTFRFAPLLFLASFIHSLDYLIPVLLSFFPGFETSTPIVAISLLALRLLRDFAASIGFLAVFQGILFPLRPLSAKALLRTGIRKLPGYFFTQFLYMTAVVFFVIISWGLLTSNTANLHYLVRPLLALFTLLAGLWIAVRLSLAPLVCLIEETSPFRAFKRSHYLTSTFKDKRHGKRDSPVIRYVLMALFPFILLLVLAAGFITYGILSGVTLPIRVKDPHVSYLLSLFAFTATFLALPFYRSGLMALYIEYRMRHEALDFYLRLRERRRQDGKSLPDVPQ